jgi:hypothetical protein
MKTVAAVFTAIIAISSLAAFSRNPGTINHRGTSNHPGTRNHPVALPSGRTVTRRVGKMSRKPFLVRLDNPQPAAIPASVPGLPTAANVYIARQQNPLDGFWQRPACAQWCWLSGDATAAMRNMTWTAWTGSRAVGTGKEHLEDCNPDCASGGQYVVPAALAFSHPVRECSASRGSASRGSASRGSGTTGFGEPRYLYSQVVTSYPNRLPRRLRSAGLRNPSKWVFTALIQEARQSCAGRPGRPGRPGKP